MARAVFNICSSSPKPLHHRGFADDQGFYLKASYIATTPLGKRGYFLIPGYSIRMCAEWGRIFKTELTIMGSHFQQRYQNGVAHFRILGVRKLFTITVSKLTRMFVLLVISKVFFIQFKKWANSFQDDLFKGLIGQIHKKKVTKLGWRKLHLPKSD